MPRPKTQSQKLLVGAIKTFEASKRTPGDYNDLLHIAHHCLTPGQPGFLYHAEFWAALNKALKK